MSAKLIMMVLTEVFIIVDIYNVQQVIKIVFVCLLDGNPYTKFNRNIRNKPDKKIIGHKDATNRTFL